MGGSNNEQQQLLCADVVVDSPSLDVPLSGLPVALYPFAIVSLPQQTQAVRFVTVRIASGRPSR